MQNSKKHVRRYGPPKETNGIANIAFALIAILIVVAITALLKDKKKIMDKQAQAIANSPQEVGIGAPLHTRYFDVTVEKTFASESIVDNSGPVSLPQENNIQYFVIAITLKNTDTESKMMPEGELHIQQDEVSVNHTPSETILAKGWGMYMENIAPGATIKTKLVYKVPAGIKGKVYYYPDKSYNNDRILLEVL